MKESINIYHQVNFSAFISESKPINVFFQTLEFCSAIVRTSHTSNELSIMMLLKIFITGPICPTLFSWRGRMTVMILNATAFIKDQHIYRYDLPFRMFSRQSVRCSRRSKI